MARQTILFNGRFLASSPTGVHRVAEELIRKIDALAADDGERTWELVRPRDANRSMALKTVSIRTAGRLVWLAWEQLELPWLARGKTLVNLCNIAPLASGGAITMIHDAQVFIAPESYSPLFRRWYRFALPRLGASAARIVTVSHFSKAQLVEHGVAPADKIVVIHNGVDHIAAVEPDRDAITALGLAPGRYAVGLANTQHHKNIAVLLAAFARPEMADVKLVLVGGAGAAAFAEAGLVAPANVVFAGRVTDQTLRGLMESAACLAFPSTTEGFGLPPLEAMFVGCPAVAAPRGALPEVCGDAADYIDPDDSAGWAKAVLRLVQDSAYRQRRSLQAKAHAAQFTWDHAARQLLQIIDETLKAKATTGR